MQGEVFVFDGFTHAQAVLDDSKADLNQAVRKEKAAKNTLAQAQARFDQNLADKNAADAVMAAIDSIMEASYGRKKAEKALANSQRALEEFLQQFNCVILSPYQ